jgi:NAD(P)-dependent dehydrogenase (short-subunit alcohol dehydrogenase family)
LDVSLDGKVALVTGAGPNIGSGIALALARYGARVSCNDLDLEVSKTAVRRISRNGGNFLFTKHAALAMIERDIRGSVVSILSSNAWQGASGFIAYATHKGGLANFVRAAAMDLAPYGIRVNSFTPTAPRPDNPELLAQWRAEGRTELRPPAAPGARDRPSWWRPTGRYDVRGNIPMGEPATPTDIGHCIAWLSSDYARLITGCDFVVDGGARAKYWAYTPDAGAAAGPVPLIPLDVSSEASDSEAFDG